MLWAAEWGVPAWHAVRDALVAAVRKAQESGAKDWFSFADADHAVRQIQAGAVQAVLVDGYCIVFNLGTPWYSPTAVVLNEYLVLRVSDRPGNFRVVPETLARIARSIPQCVGICVGTALTQDDRLTRVYQRFGFKPEANSLFRRTQWEAFSGAGSTPSTAP